MDVGVDEAGHEHAAVQAGDRLAGAGGPQRGQRAAVRDHAVADQQRLVLRERLGRVGGKWVPGRVDDSARVDRHDGTAVAASFPWVDSSSAATATAITAGSLPVMPGWPIGQVIRPIVSGL